MINVSRLEINDVANIKQNQIWKIKFWIIKKKLSTKVVF